MSKPIAILDAAPLGSVEVDLWGTMFNAVPITRSRQRELTELQREFQAIDDTVDGADDLAIEVLARMIDVHVQPAGQRRKKPSEYIIEKWQGDDLTVEQLVMFQHRLMEAV